MIEERKYIYSIIKNPKEGQATGTVCPVAGTQGINNRDVSLVVYKDLAAVVSNIHDINFDQLNKKELTQSVAVHDQVNSVFLKDHSIIPMRFGMVVENVKEIHDVLDKTYIQFKTTLERVSGKAEFVVHVFWDTQKMIGKIARENVEIQNLRKEATAKGRILGLSTKIKLGKRISETFELYRKEYIKDIISQLAIHFPNYRLGKLLDTSGDDTSYETNNTEMIINSSFLVEKTQASALELRLNQLADVYQSLKFKLIGPMPPYSFTTMNLSLGNFELIDNARKILGLDESATLLEIKDAYHRLAAQYHPDKFEYIKDLVILEETTERMKDIATANEILNIYCSQDSLPLSTEKEQAFSFRKEDVENSVMIKEEKLEYGIN